jgi:hypothetical protein
MPDILCRTTIFPETAVQCLCVWMVISSVGICPCVRAAIRIVDKYLCARAAIIDADQCLYGRMTIILPAVFCLWWLCLTPNTQHQRERAEEFGVRLTDRRALRCMRELGVRRLNARVSSAFFNAKDCGMHHIFSENCRLMPMQPSGGY